MTSRSDFETLIASISGEPDWHKSIAVADYIHNRLFSDSTVVKEICQSCNKHAIDVFSAFGFAAEKVSKNS